MKLPVCIGFWNDNNLCHFIVNKYLWFQTLWGLLEWFLHFFCSHIYFGSDSFSWVSGFLIADPFIHIHALKPNLLFLKVLITYRFCARLKRLLCVYGISLECRHCSDVCVHQFFYYMNIWKAAPTRSTTDTQLCKYFNLFIIDCRETQSHHENDKTVNPFSFQPFQ